jgi:hypothetical protein
MRPASTTVRSSEPRAPRSWSPTCAAFVAGGSAPCGAWPTENSRARGLGAQRELSSAFLDAIARAENFAPTRSNSSTCCREIVTARLERPVSSGTKEFEVPATSSPGISTTSRRTARDHAPAFANALLEGLRLALPTRRGSRFAYPRCFPSANGPYRGRTLFHRLSPVCGVRARRLFDRRPGGALTTRPLVRRLDCAVK